MTNVFQLEKNSVVGGRWIMAFGFVAFLLSFFELPFALGDGSLRMSTTGVGYWLGSLAVLIGYWFHLYGRNTRVVLSDDRFMAFGWHNRPVLDCTWAEIISYERKPCPAWWTNYPRPKWQIITSTGSGWVPYLEEYPSFQREMMRHVPRSAIPSRYIDGSFKSSDIAQLPIQQFSLRVTAEGLYTDSAVSKVAIKWTDVSFVEEIVFRVDDEVGDPRVPRIHIISDSEDFELTRFWDRYEDIRDLAFARAPGSAVLVR